MPLDHGGATTTEGFAAPAPAARGRAAGGRARAGGGRARAGGALARACDDVRTSGERARAGGEGGQATVELVALLPVLGVLALGVWQVAVAGHAMWSASAAARTASRIAAVSGGADGAAGAVRRIAGRRARVRDADDGAVRVTVPIPLVTGGDLGTFSTTARFEPQR
jgi:hypothetical protein